MRDKTTTTRYLAKLPALVVLTGAIALLQLHAIQFWTEFVGPMGWAWAVLLEVVSVALVSAPAGATSAGAGDQRARAHRPGLHRL